MEAPRDYLSGKITGSANNIDRFFGGNRHYQESNDTEFELDLSRATGYGGDRRFNLAARLNLRLPKTEGRLRLLFETDPEKNTMAPPTVGQPVLPTKVVVPKGAALAVRYETAEENHWYFRTDGGIKFPIPVRPFLRARGGYSAPLGEWRLTAAESVYWFSNLGAGETSQLDMEHTISSQFLFRATSTVIWLNNTQNFDMRQELSIFHTLNDRTALLYQASAFGISNPHRQVTDYVLLLFCRYRMHEKWLFYEISPQLHFPKANGYKSSPALNMRLVWLFDDSR